MLITRVTSITVHIAKALVRVPGLKRHRPYLVSVIEVAAPSMMLVPNSKASLEITGIRIFGGTGSIEITVL